MGYQNVIEHLGQAIPVRAYNPSDIVEGVQFVNVIVDVFLAGWEQIIPCHISAFDPAEDRVKASQSRITRLGASCDEFLCKLLRFGGSPIEQEVS